VIVKRKITSCRGCSLNIENECHWFEKPKLIPADTLKKGCKYRIARIKEINTTKLVAYIIEEFDGEIC